MDSEQSSSEQSAPAPSWRPISSHQRRVAGVLIEKAKTTPAAYPMTLNAITTGCNQKSNRAPLLNLSAEQVDDILEDLRSSGAVIEVQGGGRVAKYRHCMYEWLGVDKKEMAVMAELMLRGEQTLGELRGRAARMEAIQDISELRPIVQGLIERGLVIALTPEGRGQMVTHGLYLEREKDKLFEKLGTASTGGTLDAGESDRSDLDQPGSEPPPQPTPVAAQMTAQPVIAKTSTPANEVIDELRQEIEELKDDILQLNQRMDSLEQLLR